jgi:hypothetical protein
MKMIIWRNLFFIVMAILGVIGLIISAVFYGDEFLWRGFAAGMGIGWPIAAAIASEADMPKVSS